MGRRGGDSVVWFLIIIINISIYIVDASSLEDVTDTSALLSRHRRFALPLAHGWVFKVEFTLKVPLQDPAGSTLSIELPFSYTVDTATPVTTATGSDSYEKEVFCP